MGNDEMGWKSLFDGNVLRNGLIAAIVLMFVFQLGNDGPLIGGLILAVPFGIALVMAVSSVMGLLFTLFGIMELTNRRRRRKRA